MDAGYLCKLFLNSGSSESPTWSEVDIVRDVDVTADATETDTSARAGEGWGSSGQGLKRLSLSLEMLYDPADTNFKAIREAYVEGDPIEFAALDGEQATGQGWRAHYKITEFSNPQPLDGEVVVNVTASSMSKPHAPENPTWMNGD